MNARRAAKVCAVALLLMAAVARATETLEPGQTPKEIVSAFFDLAFVQGKAIAAAQKYISPEQYIQHNPQAADGRAAFMSGFAAYVEQSGYRCRIVQVLADGDRVAIHSHCKDKPATQRGSAVVDIFRVEQGLIVEHWDVEQAVPAKARNAHPMF